MSFKFNFSANTGYLWKELPFLDRLAMAKKYDFETVEFHDEPYKENIKKLQLVLSELDLKVNGINIRMGETFGCAAISEYSEKYQHDINEAIKVAIELKVPAIHVMSGITTADDANKTFISSLEYALENSTQTILIEPVCNEQLPGYFLRTIEQASEILKIINHPRLKILFDCYHVYKESGDLMDAFAKNVDCIGHVQISAAETRAEPLPGKLNYSKILPQMQRLGYKGAFGCEYRPLAKTEDGLAWRDSFRRDVT